jgi:nitrogen fixation protein FixH
LKVQVRDAQGHAIAGLAISGQVRRPVTDRNDQLVTFREISPGMYGARLALAPGQWVVIAEASEAGSDIPALRFKRRFSVKEAR